MTIVTFAGDVYFVITQLNVAQTNDVLEIIRKATSFWWSAAFTSVPPDSDMPADRAGLSEGLLRKLVTEAEHILVEAYDGESFLVWSAPY